MNADFNTLTHPEYPMRRSACLVMLLLAAGGAFAQVDGVFGNAGPSGMPGVGAFTADEEALIAEAIAEFEASLDYRSGIITLGDGMATLRLPDGFLYLDPADARRVLEEAWNNPNGGDNLGMVVPADLSPLDLDSWGVVIGYVEDGHVSDQDAGHLDPEALLDDMRLVTAAENDTLTAVGFPPVELVGWAETPSYDRTTRKLSWAREISFGDADIPTLNYSLRVLGREGVLTLDAIATLDRLETVRDGMAQLGYATDFNPGYGYADYGVGRDLSADYGLAALIVGAAPFADGESAATGADGIAGAPEDRGFGLLLTGFAAFVLLILGVWLGRWSRGPR